MTKVYSTFSKKLNTQIDGGLRSNSCTAISGLSSSGKTTFLLNLGNDLRVKHKLKVLLISHQKEGLLNYFGNFYHEIGFIDINENRKDIIEKAALYDVVLVDTIQDIHLKNANFDINNNNRQEIIQELRLNSIVICTTQQSSINTKDLITTNKLEEYGYIDLFLSVYKSKEITILKNRYGNNKKKIYFKRINKTKLKDRLWIYYLVKNITSKITNLF